MQWAINKRKRHIRCAAAVLAIATVLLSGCQRTMPQDTTVKEPVNTTVTTPTTVAPTQTTPPLLLTVDTEHYRIYEKDGQYHLKFYNLHIDPNTMEFEPALFDNLTDMRDAILVGDFSEGILNQIRSYSDYYVLYGGPSLSSFNVDYLADLYQGVTYWEPQYEQVRWKAIGYDQTYTASSEIRAYAAVFSFGDSVWYNHDFKSYYTDPLRSEYLGKDEERNGEIWLYKDSKREEKYILYEMEVNGYLRYVCEYYLLEWSGKGAENWFTSDTVPYRVFIFAEGEEEGAAYYVWLSGPERPSLEQLAQVGIKPYVEE